MNTRLLAAPLVVAALTCVSSLADHTAFASETAIGIDGPVHFDLSGADAESLSVVLDGHLIYATSPAQVPDIEEEAFTSSLSAVLHLPGASTPLLEIAAVDLGPGEVTDVAAHPLGLFAIANIREDDLNDINELAVIQGARVERRIPLASRADGIALDPFGEHLVVAVEKGEAIDVYDTSRAPRSVRLVASVTRDAFLPFFEGEEARLAEEDIEPESVTFSADGALALVSLQEQSSIAVVDMRIVQREARRARRTGRTPEEIGARALANVVHLPFGFENADGDTVGVEPDGLGVSPDGSFAITANEAGSPSRHLQGISVIDLRGGPRNIPEPLTLCIFDVDASLLDGTGLTSCPAPGPNGEVPAEHDVLPRLDPNNAKIVERGGRMICAVNLERKTLAQDRGSVLFLDVSDILSGVAPGVVDRKLVGLNPGARPEGLQASNEGRFVWVAIQDDGGTIARFELSE